ITGQVGIVEGNLGMIPIHDRQPPSAQLVPSFRHHSAVIDRADRCPFRSHHIGPFMGPIPAVAAASPPGISVGNLRPFFKGESVIFSQGSSRPSVRLRQTENFFSLFSGKKLFYRSPRSLFTGTVFSRRFPDASR